MLSPSPCGEYMKEMKALDLYSVRHYINTH
jgi:hypothetical protein